MKTLNTIAAVLAITLAASTTALAASDAHWKQVSDERSEVISRDGKVLVQLTTTLTGGKLAITFSEQDDSCKDISVEPQMESVRSVNDHLIYMVKKCTAPGIATWHAQNVEDNSFIIDQFKTMGTVKFDRSVVTASKFSVVKDFVKPTLSNHKVPKQINTWATL